MDIEYSASVMNKVQLDTAVRYRLKKIYIPYDLFYRNELMLDDIDSIHHGSDTDVYISLPQIIRKKDNDYLERLKSFLLLGKADGILIRNLEELGFINSLSKDLEKQFISINGRIDGYTSLFIEADQPLYCANRNALRFMNEYCDKVTAPAELSIHELKELEDRDLIIVIYGRALLMVSANCVRKTADKCDPNDKSGFDFIWSLKDRKNMESLVVTNCTHCYNEIYNSVVTSLHKSMWDLIKAGFHEFRIDLTNESAESIGELLDYYLIDHRSGRYPFDEYTAAHISKGVL